MKFTPMDEKDAAAQEFSLLPDGDYDYEVTAAEPQVSKAGNDMIKLELTIFDGETRRKVWNYLVASAGWKIRQFAASCGLMDQYNAGTLDSIDCEGRTGRVAIATQESDGYPPKNVVKAYLKDKRSSAPPARLRGKMPADNMDDEIPF